MASDLVLGVSLALMVVLALSVLGTVKRTERLAFVPGVLLVIAGQSLLTGFAAGVVAVVGLALVLASALPMLVE